MADRSYLPPAGSLEVGVVELFAELTFGSAGAVTLTSGKGFASATQESGDGLYTLALSDEYNRLLWGGITLLDDTASAASTVGIGARFESEDVDGSSAAANVKVQFYALDDGADADPADGAKAYVMLKLRNSSVS